MRELDRELDKVMLQGLKFYGYHGAMPEEKTLGQCFEIDVELWGDFSQGAVTDSLEETQDYGQVYWLIKEIAEGPSVNLLEHLAQRISEALLALPLIQKVLVRVKKPQVPLPGVLGYAGVEIVRTKSTQAAQPAQFERDE